MPYKSIGIDECKAFLLFLRSPYFVFFQKIAILFLLRIDRSPCTSPQLAKNLLAAATVLPGVRSPLLVFSVSQSQRSTTRLAEMDKLEELRHLSLVSKVCVEIQNHLGIEDKVLAEYLISLVRKSPDIMSFRSMVASACGGKPLPDALTASVYRAVPQTPIQHPQRAMRQYPNTNHSWAPTVGPSMYPPVSAGVIDHGRGGRLENLANTSSDAGGFSDQELIASGCLEQRRRKMKQAAPEASFPALQCQVQGILRYFPP